MGVALEVIKHEKMISHLIVFVDIDIHLVSWVATLQQITIIHNNNRKDIQHDSNESRIQLIQYKDPNNSGRNK